MAGRIAHIAIVEEHLHAIDVRVLVEMVNALRIETRRATDNAVHFIPLVQEKFSQVATVLSGDARNECLLCHDSRSFRLF